MRTRKVTKDGDQRVTKITLVTVVEGSKSKTFRISVGSSKREGMGVISQIENLKG